VLKALEGRKYQCTNPIYAKSIEWLRFFTHQKSGYEFTTPLRDKLLAAICEAFDVNKAQVIASLDGIELPSIPKPVKPNSEEKALEAILPKGGWFEWYTEYTRKTESPLSYHIFSSLCVLSACLGRRLVLDMGFYRVFPNMCVVLVGPTGLVKKTSACDIAKDLIKQEAVCPILAEQLNPSVLVSLLARNGGHQLLYLPEMSNTFTKERFNDGLTTRLLRLLDCPDKYEAETQIRGNETVTDVALTVLGGTTPDQIAESMPKEVVQSGFLNRFMWIVEMDTDRCCPKPSKGPYEDKILKVIKRLKGWSGKVQFREDSDAFKFYTQWYEDRKKKFRTATDVSSARAMQRGDVHLLKLAILISTVQEDSLAITLPSIQCASKLLEYVERKMPKMVNFLDKAPIKQETNKILDVLQRMGGAADHSSILRRLSGAMTSAQFKAHIKSLAEQELVTISTRGSATFYILRSQEEGKDAGKA
jgi:hypothetical protein